MDRLLTISEVATRLGVGIVRVRELDDILTPHRAGTNRQRLYDPAIVERVRKEREKAKKAAKRAS